MVSTDHQGEGARTLPRLGEMVVDLGDESFASSHMGDNGGLKTRPQEVVSPNNPPRQVPLGWVIYPP